MIDEPEIDPFEQEAPEVVVADDSAKETTEPDEAELASQSALDELNKLMSGEESPNEEPEEEEPEKEKKPKAEKEEEEPDNDGLKIDLGEEEEEDPEAEGEEEEEETPNVLEDPMGWISTALKGKKTGELRKTLAAKEGQIQALTAEMDKVREEAETGRSKIEEIETQQQIRMSEVEPIDIQEYEPFKDLNEKYLKNLEGTKGRIRKKANVQAFEGDYPGLIQDLRAIKQLDATQSDEKLEQMEESIIEKYGEADGNKVIDFVHDGLQMWEESQKVKSDFEGESQKKSTEYHQKIYDDASKNIKDTLPKLWEFDEELSKANPFASRNVVSKIADQNPDWFKKVVKEDSELVTRLFAGDKPFNYDDPQWRGMEEKQARIQYAKQVKDTRELNAKLGPELIAQGLMAQRIIPVLAKKVSALPKAAKSPKPKSSRSSSSGKKPKDASPQDPAKAAQAAGDEISQLISNAS